MAMKHFSLGLFCWGARERERGRERGRERDRERGRERGRERRGREKGGEREKGGTEGWERESLQGHD